MKTIALFALALAPGVLLAQSHTEEIKKELQFEKRTAASTLMIMNVNGHVKVEGYAGDKVVVEVTKNIYGKTDARVERGKSEIQLGVIDRADTILLYVRGVCNEFGIQRNGRQGNRNRYGGWGYNWNCNGNDCEKDYDWEMDFTVKVPMGINILASTINNGNVEIRNTSAYAHAENVNGSVRLEQVSGGGTYASTINGDVDVDYVRNPSQECRYYSLNGEVNVLFVKGLSANVGFDSFNGDLFTNVDQLESLPAVVEKTNKGNGSLRLRIGGQRFRIGAGGPFLDFETFNGNAYIKEKL